MVKRFRECHEPCERARPIICLTTQEHDRLYQLAEVSGISFSEMVEAVIRDWLTTDLEQLAAMNGTSHYSPPPFGIGVGQ